MKKNVLLLFIALLFTSPVYALEMSDISPHEYKDSIQKILEQNIISGLRWTSLAGSFVTFEMHHLLTPPLQKS